MGSHAVETLLLPMNRSRRLSRQVRCTTSPHSPTMAVRHRLRWQLSSGSSSMRFEEQTLTVISCPWRPRRSTRRFQISACRQRCRHSGYSASPRELTSRFRFGQPATIPAWCHFLTSLFDGSFGANADLLACQRLASDSLPGRLTGTALGSAKHESAATGFRAGQRFGHCKRKNRMDWGDKRAERILIAITIRTTSSGTEITATRPPAPVHCAIPACETVAQEPKVTMTIVRPLATIPNAATISPHCQAKRLPFASAE